MNVTGMECVEALTDQEGYLMKLIANETAAHFFPYTIEHRDIRISGLNYEDDSAGNALAAMVKPGVIEFRHHRDFSDQRVREIAARIVASPVGEFASSFSIHYQGRILVQSSS
ncbi:hypothetical protein [Allorhodopirellula heiligendammensis]|uniref:Uncharacterized protein n=1 Tax=Allorhodopirellula heiligendammensis TaxID=2714739 RepID=A0A5C6BZR4_9BACT|nr:hypothetical protein [Allorhodopirellula heiligendammensis]TWU17860.1 hypothetical protein Poly21_00110 [Allorhodopirellula heiligendammensis]